MGGNNSKVTAQDKAILDMKLQRDKLRQYQKRITVLTDKETAMAKQMLAAGNKSGALLALRRKKYQETLLSKTDSQLAQLEQLTSNVEFALIQKDVMYGIQQGTKVLNEIHAEMGGLEGVEKMMGENEEAIAYQREISETLNGRMSTQDEEEVEDELAAMEARLNEDKEAERAAAQRQDLPVAPDTELTTPEREPTETEPTPARVAERRQMLAA
ncbi:Snf7 family [Plectosphaerella cucumerina]|uniref:Snf7 family n=1 Tax=Plectosphaerella cucumerina TaxID=40658 RepID=A0A8K0TGW9_9PEZI|nr:Snf7 family [Plectosphaerella cucumerina]